MIELFHYMHLRVSGWDLLRLIAAGIASALTYALGDTDNWLLGLIVLMVADYISGVTAAYIRNELSSKRGLAGVLKKLLLFCIVMVATIIDRATGAGGVLRSAAIGFLMANEGISVLENAGRCGVPLPQRLLKALEQLRGEDHQDAEKPPDDADGQEDYDNDGSGD